MTLDPDSDQTRRTAPDAAGPPGITVTDATTDEQLDAVRALMRSFVAWHRERHVADLRLIDGYFDAAAFDEEVAGLPGKYGRPEGRLLLASVNGIPAGCVALRSLGDGSSEMKRMFVDPEFRGRGVGKALAIRLIDEARSAGYRTMRLDTSVRQLEAIGLYERLGFSRIEPYYELPAELVDWLVFMELAL
jgi:ribosomal protein S18 acetylase RimI-like enzyme